MLLAIGPGVGALQDYTMSTNAKSIRVTQNQGDTLDTFKCVTTDLLSSYTIAPEDDLVWINEKDSNGFPAVNLLQWPDFGGTYTSGVAQGWTLDNGAATGVTAAKYTGGCPANTTQGQSITISNVANGTQLNLHQTVALPTDEKNNVIVSPGYCASVYVLVPVSMSGVGSLFLQVDWLNSAGSFISNNNVNYSIPSSQFGWNRYSIGSGILGVVVNSPWIPPTGAVSAKFRLFFSTTSSTNSGQIVFAAAQLEPCTFANYRTTDFISLSSCLNSTMASATTSGSARVDNYFLNYGPTGTTWSIVTSPTIYGKSQQLSISNVAPTGTTISIAQNIMHHADYTYTVTATYQVTSAFTGGAQVRVGATLSNDAFNATGIANAGVSSTWQVLQFSYGPGAATNNHLSSPTGGATRIYFGVIENSNATNSGTVVLGALTVNAVPSTHATAYTKAINFGQYPTTFVGPNGAVAGPGVHYDNKDKLWYRHQRFFGGLIRNVVYDYSKSAERQTEIDAVDYSVLLNEAPATLLIQKQADNLAIKQAGDYARNLGFLDGIDYTTYVQNIITVDAMLFNWQTTRDVISKIADHSVAAFWVDPYKFLHYQQALATTTPFGVSDNPNMSTTFPAESLKIQNDSTGTLTTPVIEGSTQLSAPQTLTFNGYNTTTTAGITQGTNLTSLSVTAINFSIAAGSYFTVSSGATMFSATASANVVANATSIPIVAQTAPFTVASGTNVNLTGVQLNSSFPVAQIDSTTVGGTGLTIGIINVNSYSQGYTALIDLQAGVLYFQSAPINGTGNIVVVYRFTAPVIVRLHAPLVESSTGKVRRKIHQHITETTISSQQSAIDRANAEITTSSKPKAIGEIVLRTPHTPFDNTLTVGQAIPVTFAKAGLGQTLYQIQQIDTSALGNNQYVRTLKIGYYRPDFVVYMAQAKRHENFSDSFTADTVLQDVLSSADAWALGDSLVFTVSNVGIWGTNAGSGNWGAGTNILVWG